jgi:hypothetical protein
MLWYIYNLRKTLIIEKYIYIYIPTVKATLCGSVTCESWGTTEKEKGGGGYFLRRGW